jgi:cyclopropane-fatty-acyl-phospholipid synthase
MSASSLDSLTRLVGSRLESVGITLNGPHPWDPQIHDLGMVLRALSPITGGDLKVGEAFQKRAWDVADLPEFIRRFRSVTGTGRGGSLRDRWFTFRIKHLNLQSYGREHEVAEHYNWGNELYEHMLGVSMAYTAANWDGAHTLDDAQYQKLARVAAPLNLTGAEHILDVGCGWGTFGRYITHKLPTLMVTGVTIAEEQISYGKKYVGTTHVQFEKSDYRAMSAGPYDHAISIEMIEAVGPQNFRTYFKAVYDRLKPGGKFILRVIGRPEGNVGASEWMHRYIFPNGYIPSLGELSSAVDGLFVMDRIENFARDYAHTLMAWDDNLTCAWPTLVVHNPQKYTDVARRTWQFYLGTCAGGFLSDHLHLWQLELTRL